MKPNNALAHESLCLKRLPSDHGWCLLADNHPGICIGRPSLDPPEQTDHGPRRAVQMMWGK